MAARAHAGSTVVGRGVGVCGGGGAKSQELVLSHRQHRHLVKTKLTAAVTPTQIVLACTSLTYGLQITTAAPAAVRTQHHPPDLSG